MKKNIIMMALALAFTVNAHSQTPVEKNEKPKKVFNGPSGHAIGVAISSSNGKGLGYRYWAENAGFHVTFFPSSSNNNKYYNGGVTGYLNLREYNFGRLFLHAGIEYEYRERNDSYSIEMPSNNYPYYYSYQQVSYQQKCNGFNIGAGPGVHVLSKYVSMDIYLGYGLYTRDWMSNDSAAPANKDTQVMTLTGGVALWLEL
ncbi:MAG: hypothetical protein IPP69_06775 [Flavobacteriales bacterium]|nr:hypothetical protein [Flavobacteriales bacterium]